MPSVQGHCDPRFNSVKQAFSSCFDDGLEQGAALAVMLDGKLVAHVWSGHTDKAKTKPWGPDTLVNVWSCTKGVVATAVAMAVERGQLRYDEPIAKIWPEFAANGKGSITLDHVMSHTAGLNGLNTPVSEDIVYDWQAYTAALAAMKPNWEPGTACAYHALTYGHLASEPLRRVTAKSIGAFIASEIAGPLGAEFYVGLPETADGRAAAMVEGPGASDWIGEVLKSKYPHGVMNPTPVATAPNERRWRAAEIPGGNGFGTAAGLAGIYGDLVNRQSKLLRKETLAEASRIRFRGQDESFNAPTAWGAGFRLEDAEVYGRKSSLKTIGHGGWGGSIGFGDPEAQLGFAYVTNFMQGFPEGKDPRRQRCVDAVYGCL